MRERMKRIKSEASFVQDFLFLKQFAGVRYMDPNIFLHNL